MPPCPGRKGIVLPFTALLSLVANDLTLIADMAKDDAPEQIPARVYGLYWEQKEGETMADKQSRKYNVTINNPTDKGLDHDTIKRILEQFKSCVYWCMADEIGLDTQTPHTHIYIQLKSSTRFSRIKKLLPEAHIESAQGTAQENRAYVQKSGKWANDPKADTSVPGTFEESGPLPDEPGQGTRTDFEEIEAMLNDGQTPAEIMSVNFAYRRYERMIRSAYFDKRKRETPTKREVKIHYLVGESGSGKSYTYTTLCEEHGEDNVYFLTDYDGGGFDSYCGEPILFMDEYKGQFRFAQFLILTDCYKSQIHARYANVVAVWNEVYITSVFPPEELYKKMVEESARGQDKQQQLLRRISDITYCFVDASGEYQRYTVPMAEYTDYEELKAAAMEHMGAVAPAATEFADMDETEQFDLPF